MKAAMAMPMPMPMPMLDTKPPAAARGLGRINQTGLFRLSAVYAAMNERCRLPGGQAQLAREVGVSVQFINAVLNARKSPTPALLHALGFRKVVAFERVA
jgi:transcriptional regulator with XRE-family HTH domain